VVAPFYFPPTKGITMSKKKRSRKQPQHFSLRDVKPLTVNQQETFESWYQGQNLLLHGVAGTGKTFISLYLALEEILRNSYYNKIIVIRSVVPSRDMGFLPGNAREKARIYEEPYKEICDDLFGRGDGYDVLKMKHMVEFTTTSFLRGMTFNNAIVIVDECQNMVMQELDTVITRMGDNSRIVFCGDFRQTDLQKEKEKSGLHTFMNILRGLSCFDRIEFGTDDIVRSGVVRDYILSKLELGIV
jgi:phosphate starvation-inducible protein PhoH